MSGWTGECKGLCFDKQFLTHDLPINGKSSYKKSYETCKRCLPYPCLKWRPLEVDQEPNILQGLCPPVIKQSGHSINVFLRPSAKSFF